MFIVKHNNTVYFRLFFKLNFSGSIFKYPTEFTGKTILENLAALAGGIFYRSSRALPMIASLLLYDYCRHRRRLCVT